MVVACQSDGFFCNRAITSAISGPRSKPVTAFRSGMNSPLPLRPVCSLTAPVQAWWFGAEEDEDRDERARGRGYPGYHDDQRR